MSDSHFYIYAIALLLPLAASMVVVQGNPYHALILRGILGAMAALIYTVLGAADVALTEALVGTLLAIALYAVAVRSSLVMRLGILESETSRTTMLVDDDNPHASQAESPFEQLVTGLRAVFSKYYMRVELVPYINAQMLQQALMDKEIHAICVRSPASTTSAISAAPTETVQQNLPTPYITTTRVPRLYNILQSELPPSLTQLRVVAAPEEQPSSYQPLDAGSVLGEET